MVIGKQVILSSYVNQLILAFFFCINFSTDGIVSTAVSARDMSKLERKKRELEEDNNILRMKMDILLEMLAEVTAEHDLRRQG